MNNLSAGQRIESVKQKVELIRAGGHCAEAEGTVVATRREVARLLAAAYGRYATIRRVRSDQAETSGKEELANSLPESVHEGVA